MRHHFLDKVDPVGGLSCTLRGDAVVIQEDVGQQATTDEYLYLLQCQKVSTGTGTCNKRLAETRVAVTCIGERYMYNT